MLAKGICAIIGAALAPWGAFALGQATLAGTIVLSAIAALGAGYTWTDQALGKLEAIKLAKIAAKRKVDETTGGDL